MTTHQFTIGDYLLQRLHEVGVRHLFGVPGDYNLAFLDHVIDDEHLTWVGNANELNAAYAADGYARLNGVGALLTTFGVGELSAVNGIAGAYAEYVPIVHIVGAPSTVSEQAGEPRHHTLQDGDFRHFTRMHTEVTVAQAYLTPGAAAGEIDRVLATVVRERRPGYLVLPTDVAASPIDPPAAPLVVPPPDFSATVLDAFRAHAREVLADAESATVLADFPADRFGVRAELNALLAAGGFPRAVLASGKGVLDESDPAFAGTYFGSASEKTVREAVESADVVIGAGARFTELVTAGFTHDIAPQRLIDLQPFAASIGDRRYAPLPLDRALTVLTELTAELGRDWSRPLLPADRTDTPVAPELRQSELWNAVQDYLRPGDIVVAEQGTAYYGAAPLRLPKGVDFIGQPLWGSIGYTLPAAFGAQTSDPSRRLLLLIGDGSALLTAQEIGTMVRDGLAPIILLLNNNGYTVERAIHGAEQRYNDIPRWDWSLVPRAMGADNRVRTLRAATARELDDALALAANTDELVLLEVMLPKMDAPELLSAIANSIITANAR